MKWLDTNNAVLRWGSEELAIPYIHPFDGRMHRYYPDMVIMYMDVSGNVKREIIEIKPHKESVATPKMSDRDRQALLINQAKWKYAAEYAEKNGAVFRVLTEQTMFKQKPRKAVGAAV